MSDEVESETWDGYFKIFLNLEGDFDSVRSSVMRALPGSIADGLREIQYGQLVMAIVVLNEVVVDSEDFLDWGFGIEVRRPQNLDNDSFLSEMVDVVNILRKAGFEVVVAGDSEDRFEF
jgi:hypothetical protein